MAQTIAYNVHDEGSIGQFDRMEAVLDGARIDITSSCTRGDQTYDRPSPGVFSPPDSAATVMVGEHVSG
ncbi:MAG: hypothetical protein R2849_11380 [Thermomicrobiales bacterium]